MFSIPEVVAPGFLGTDLALSEGDLAVADTADYATVEDEDNLAAARLRRLNTPKGAAAVLIEDVTGLKLVRSEFGNGAQAFKAEPTTVNLPSKVRQAIVDCINDDDREEVLDVSHRIDEDSPRIVIDVDTAVRGGERTSTSSIAYAGGRIEVL